MSPLETCSADVIDHILTSSTTIGSLQSLSSTSKAIHTIFKAHPQSIIKAVALNEVGEALPQALRLVRCRNRRHADPMRLPKESEMVGDDEPITIREARLLSRNAQIAKELEDLFSWRFKDRMFRTSKLTQQESYKFQATLYRFWLFSRIYGCWKYEREPDFTDEEEDQDQDDNSMMFAAVKKRHDFLQNFSTQELAELEKIVHFLEDTAGWAMRSNWEELREHQGEGYHIVTSHINQYCKVLALLGPDAALEAYQARSVNAAYETRNTWFGETDMFFATPLMTVREERLNLQQEEDSTSSTNSKIIISHVVGEDDKCTRCDARKGVDLWNETNWDFLIGVINPHIHTYLPGLLSQNRAETVPLRKEIQSMGYRAFLIEMFNMKEAPYDNIHEQDWLCLDCLEGFIKRYLCAWWLDWKRADGQVIENDCWYGWNCRTMRHKYLHALKLNHLCVPTRGDTV